MSSANTGGKKATFCRYFLSGGTCAYGDECQFLHQNPNESNIKPYSNGFPQMREMQDNPGGGPEAMANNGDQFFNATFSSQSPATTFHQFVPPQQMPRSRNNFMPSPSALSQNAKPFVPSNGNRMEQNVVDDFAALNLANTGGGGGKGPIPQPHAGNELFPKAGTLPHSSSTPSFASYATMPTVTSSLPTNQIANTNLSLTTKASPTPSPGLSPANSPLLMRRATSPGGTVHNAPGAANKAATAAAAAKTVQENVGGTTYFYCAEDFTPQHQGIVLPNFSMYPGLPAHVAHMKLKSNMPQFSMPDEIKLEMLNRHSLTLAQIDLTQNPDIPAEVDNYHNLFPLEPPPPSANALKGSTFNYPTTCYKAVNTKDGLCYCLRRIHGFRLVNTKCMTIIDMWKKMYHPNIVQLREVFTTKAFGDHSMVFVYDFFPGSETLMSRHFNNPNHQLNGYSSPYNLDGMARPYSAGKGVNGPRQHAGLLPESLIWAYIVQLSSSLRAVHAAGLACRAMDPTKILIMSKSRLRLNSMGMFDVLTYDTNQTNALTMMPHYQQEDLMSLGKVVLALACNSVIGIQSKHIPTSMDLVARNYSADLKNLIIYLLTNQTRHRSVNDIMPMIGARFYTQLDAAQLRSDVLENELGKEVENGRLFRLLCKLGTINERPEYNMDPAWSETGDRYMLKLFRDYLFHQVDENSAPWIDMAHVVQCMNKLDAGVPEKICLMSRDAQSVIVVTYTELKQCFENGFGELLNAADRSAAATAAATFT